MWSRLSLSNESMRSWDHSATPLLLNFLLYNRKEQLPTKRIVEESQVLLFVILINIDLVEILTIFIQTVSPYVEPNHEHPAVHLLSELWPTLCDTLTIFGKTQYVSESVAKNFKNIIYSYRIHSLPLLGPMAEKLVTSFEQYEYGCFLWVSGAIVRQFGHEEVDNEVRFAIWQFVERQCVNTFRLLEKNKPNDIPDRTFPCFQT